MGKRKYSGNKYTFAVKSVRNNKQLKDSRSGVKNLRKLIG